MAWEVVAWTALHVAHVVALRHVLRQDRACG